MPTARKTPHPAAPPLTPPPRRSNYHIALHPGTLQLFAYVEVEDEARWAAIAGSDVCKRWWAWMQDFIVFKADGTPDAVELREMFFFDPAKPEGR